MISSAANVRSGQGQGLDRKDAFDLLRAVLACNVPLVFAVILVAIMRNGSNTREYPAQTAPSWHFRFKRHLTDLNLLDAAAYQRWCRAQGFGPALRKTWRQRREEQLCARKLAEEARQDQELNRHLAEVGFRDPREYRHWCARQGYEAALRKGLSRRIQERKAVEWERASAALVHARMLRRRPEDFIRAVFEGALRGSDLRNDAERELARVVGAPKPKI